MLVFFFKVLKYFRKEKTENDIGIYNANGKILTERNDIMNRWKEYFQGLLGGKEINKDDHKVNINEEEDREDGEVAEEKITMHELEVVIKGLKSGRSPGTDKITAEMIKNMGKKGKEILLEIINKAWTSVDIPREWEEALIVPIFKKGNARDCNNYRGINLLNTIVKVYEQIINNKLVPILENSLEESQTGFRSGRSGQDHIFTLQQIAEKSIQQDKLVCLAFIDLEKAFDSVPRTKIWESLKNRGIRSKIIKVVQRLYKNNVNYVIGKNMRSLGFTTNYGLRQGGGQNPTLFNLYMDDLIVH